MNLIVMKFGGTSIGNIDKIYNVANIVEKESKSNKIIVVLSAMAGVTNQLQSYVEEVSSEPSRETDLVITSGEQVTAGLLSMILNGSLAGLVSITAGADVISPTNAILVGFLGGAEMLGGLFLKLI